MKNDEKLNHLSVFGWAMLFLCCWNNADMTLTMMCNMCDVMNMIWCKIQMALKSDNKRLGVGGGRKRETALSFGIDIYVCAAVFCISWITKFRVPIRRELQ